MSDHNFPADRRYTKDHEWARAEAGEVFVGVSAFAVEQLGDITLVNVDAKVGDAVHAGKPFGTIESVKTLSDMFAPVSGTVTKVNGDLENKPEVINEDCYAKGWIVAIKPSAASELDALMDAEAYTKHVASEHH